MMGVNGISTSPDKHVPLLNELECLLNEQVAMVRKRNLDGFEELVEKSGTIVDQLGQIGIPEPVELGERFERLVKSYRTVILSVAVEKDSLEKQLQQINQGRKTLRTYRG